MNEMTLCEEIINIFGEELRTIFKKELEDEDYMKQTFLGSKFRAFVAIFVAFKNSFKRMVNVLALAIAKHRLEEHDDDNESEVDSLTESMSDEDVETATTKGGWTL